MPKMIKLHITTHEKLDQSHCQKSLCCLGIAIEVNDYLLDSVIQTIDLSYFYYKDQLMVGVYHLPYQSLNHALFL